MTLHQSSTGFKPSDLLQRSAELSLGIEPADMSAHFMDTPFFSGRILMREVQPGLMITAEDITYLTSQSAAVDMEASLICGILLDGEPDTMVISDRHRVSKAFQRPVLVGFSKRSGCLQVGGPPRRSASAGFVLKPTFFDRFADDVTDDGLAALRDFVEADFRTETLPRSARLVDIARRTLDHPYNGQLGELFLESNTLSFVAEVADQLKQQRSIIASLGQRHYDRVMHARDIIDRNVVFPPATLELARQVGVNITTLQANFKAVFETTIFGYVRDQRLAMGRILLLEHSLSVADAGRKVGFSSPSAFSAAYRRHFGHPPTSERSRPK